MSLRKAALIELYDWHGVNLYSQLLFLKNGGYDTTLICSEKLREEVAPYHPGQETIYVNCAHKKGIRLWQGLWQIRQLIIEGNFDTVIFNTAHSNPVRNLCMMPFPAGIRFYGNLHGVNKLTGSGTQYIISRRIHRYFLLNDYMLEKALKTPHEGLKFGVYYPIFHPHFPEQKIVPKLPGDIWIAIPGSVEYARRDYTTLLEALKKVNTIPGLRFFLLGNSDRTEGRHLKQQITEAGLAEQFFSYNGFMPDALLHAYIRQCDAVLPLIHPVNAAMEKYLENQISGSYNLAFAYQKPLLMHGYFRRYEDFRDTSFFYELEDLPELLAHLLQALQSLQGSIYRLPKWTLSYQQSQYLRFLES